MSLQLQRTISTAGQKAAPPLPLENYGVRRFSWQEMLLLARETGTCTARNSTHCVRNCFFDGLVSGHDCSRAVRDCVRNSIRRALCQGTTSVVPHRAANGPGL